MTTNYPLDVPLKHYTYQQAGQILGVSDRTVWSLVREGRLKAVRFGRTVRISAEAIEHFIRAHERADDGR